MVETQECSISLASEQEGYLGSRSFNSRSVLIAMQKQLEVQAYMRRRDFETRAWRRNASRVGIPEDPDKEG